jgi:hypothetical protein
MKRNENHSSDKISTYDFNDENKCGLLDLFENLPKQYYQIELFETTDKTGFILCFDEDLFIKVLFEDREEFEKFFGFKIGDHVDVDLRHLQIGDLT